LRAKRSNLTRSVIPSGARNLVEIATGFTLATTSSDCHAPFPAFSGTRTYDRLGKQFRFLNRDLGDICSEVKVEVDANLRMEDKVEGDGM
jgi:hypothetical protein